ncbi:2814_t:CDS:2 [Cetraspora pellucida]|uniref:2814_t:CDS:1 n=1 Tax=Cetraspora pellucida TaxID=1433469 RepID=A0ACA9MUN4_9GLOM|nr:2814_t:CDS:2 [Cetraspora pellucida]
MAIPLTSSKKLPPTPFHVSFIFQNKLAKILPEQMRAWKISMAKDKKIGLLRGVFIPNLLDKFKFLLGVCIWASLGVLVGGLLLVLFKNKGQLIIDNTPEFLDYCAKSNGLVFFGPIGSGKTAILAMLANELPGENKYATFPCQLPWAEKAHQKISTLFLLILTNALPAESGSQFINCLDNDDSTKFNVDNNLYNNLVNFTNGVADKQNFCCELVQCKKIGQSEFCVTYGYFNRKLIGSGVCGGIAGDTSVTNNSTGDCPSLDAVNSILITSSPTSTNSLPTPPSSPSASGANSSSNLPLYIGVSVGGTLLVVTATTCYCKRKEIEKL